MKVIVCSAVKLSRLKTHLWLQNSGVDYHYCVHTDDDVLKLADHTGIPTTRIHAMDPPNIGVGIIGWMRHSAEQLLTEPGEWYCFIDDDVMISKLCDPYYDLEVIDLDDPEYIDVDWREAFVTPMTAKDFPSLLSEIQGRCEEQGTILGGITWNDNFYFRLVKWKRRAFVCGAFSLTMHHPDIPWIWHPASHIAEDGARSCFVMERYGSIVLNQFATIAPLGSQEDSSIGPLSYRASAWRETRRAIAERFYGLVSFKTKKNGDIQMVWKSQRSIDEWRRLQGCLGKETTDSIA